MKPKLTLEEKCKIAIEQGFTYNPETGFIYGRRGTVITGKDKGYIIVQAYHNKFNYKIYGHIFAYYYVNKHCVQMLDHINQIRDDNRILNLRPVTHQQNMWNTKSEGVSWHKRDKIWFASLGINGKKIHLGNFKTKEEALEARKAGELLYRKTII